MGLREFLDNARRDASTMAHGFIPGLNQIYGAAALDLDTAIFGPGRQPAGQLGGRFKLDDVARAGYQGFVRDSPILPLLTGDIKEAGNRFYERPISSGLDLLGAGAVAGKGLKAASYIPGPIGESALRLRGFREFNPAQLGTAVYSHEFPAKLELASGEVVPAREYLLRRQIETYGDKTYAKRTMRSPRSSGNETFDAALDKGETLADDPLVSQSVPRARFQPFALMGDVMNFGPKLGSARFGRRLAIRSQSRLRTSVNEMMASHGRVKKIWEKLFGKGSDPDVGDAQFLAAAGFKNWDDVVKGLEAFQDSGRQAILGERGVDLSATKGERFNLNKSEFGFASNFVKRRQKLADDLADDIEALAPEGYGVFFTGGKEPLPITAEWARANPKDVYDLSSTGNLHIRPQATPGTPPSPPSPGRFGPDTPDLPQLPSPKEPLLLNRGWAPLGNHKEPIQMPHVVGEGPRLQAPWETGQLFDTRQYQTGSLLDDAWKKRIEGKPLPISKKDFNNKMLLASDSKNTPLSSVDATDAEFNRIIDKNRMDVGGQQFRDPFAPYMNQKRSPSTDEYWKENFDEPPFNQVRMPLDDDWTYRDPGFSLSDHTFIKGDNGDFFVKLPEGELISARDWMRRAKGAGYSPDEVKGVLEQYVDEVVTDLSADFENLIKEAAKHDAIRKADELRNAKNATWEAERNLHDSQVSDLKRLTDMVDQIFSGEQSITPNKTSIGESIEGIRHSELFDAVNSLSDSVSDSEFTVLDTLRNQFRNDLISEDEVRHRLRDKNVPDAVIDNYVLNPNSPYSSIEDIIQKSYVKPYEEYDHGSIAEAEHRSEQRHEGEDQPWAIDEEEARWEEARAALDRGDISRDLYDLITADPLGDIQIKVDPAEIEALGDLVRSGQMTPEDALRSLKGIMPDDQAKMFVSSLADQHADSRYFPDGTGQGQLFRTDVPYTNKKGADYERVVPQKYRPDNRPVQGPEYKPHDGSEQLPLFDTDSGQRALPPGNTPPTPPPGSPPFRGSGGGFRWNDGTPGDPGTPGVPAGAEPPRSWNKKLRVKVSDNYSQAQWYKNALDNLVKARLEDGPDISQRFAEIVQNPRVKQIFESPEFWDDILPQHKAMVAAQLEADKVRLGANALSNDNVVRNSQRLAMIFGNEDGHFFVARPRRSPTKKPERVEGTRPIEVVDNNNPGDPFELIAKGTLDTSPEVHLTNYLKHRNEAANQELSDAAIEASISITPQQHKAYISKGIAVDEPHTNQTGKIMSDFVVIRPGGKLFEQIESMQPLAAQAARRLREEGFHEQASNISSFAKEMFDSAADGDFSLGDMIRNPKLRGELEDSRYMMPTEMYKALVDETSNATNALSSFLQAASTGFKILVLHGRWPAWVVNNTIGAQLYLAFTGGLGRTIPHTGGRQLVRDVFPDVVGSGSREMGTGAEDLGRIATTRKEKLLASKPGKISKNIIDTLSDWNQKIADEPARLERLEQVVEERFQSTRDLAKARGIEIPDTLESRRKMLQDIHVREDIAKEVLDDMIDFTNMSRRERMRVASAIPFWSFIKGSTKSTQRLVADHPGRVWAPMEIGSMGSEYTDQEYPSGVPEYMRSILPMGGTKALSVGGWNPWGQQQQLLGGVLSILNSEVPTGQDHPLAMVNPILTMPVESVTNREFYTQYPMTGNVFKNMGKQTMASIPLLETILSVLHPGQPTGRESYIPSRRNTLLDFAGIPIHDVNPKNLNVRLRTDENRRRDDGEDDYWKFHSGV